MVKLITEFCQNHNGDFDILSRMVEQAANSGATYGKMQNIFADTVSYRPQFENGVVEDGIVKAIKRPYADEYKRLKKLEISFKDTEKFIQICKDNGLIPMTTCFTRSHVNVLSELGFKSIKVASYDCASFPMLRELNDKYEEIIVSTGAMNDDEIKYAATILNKSNFSLLHCVTLYPTPLDSLHLNRMRWLKKLSHNVGYSDHSHTGNTGLIASKLAMALGADIIERHFTILPANQTKDGPVSITPNQLKDLSDFSKLSIDERLQSVSNDFPNWKIMLGDINRKLSHEELLNRDYYRGRFASPRPFSIMGTNMIYNWEDTPIESDEEK
jgi:N,N'-diacetyllegionaminate synthase